MCHISPLPPIKSGISKYTSELMTALENRGIEVFAVSWGGSCQGIETLDLKKLGFGRTVSEIRKRRPELIHYHFSGSYKNYFVIVCNIFLRRKNNIPHVVTIHDLPIVSLVKLNKVEPIRKLVWLGLLRGIEKKLCEANDLLIVHSRFAMNLLLSYYGVLCCKIRVIPFGLSLEERSSVQPELLREKLDLPHNRLIVLSGGFLYPTKGYDNLLLSFARLKHRNRASMVMFGEGSFLKELKRLASKLGLKDDVKFPGYVPLETMVGYFNACDFVVIAKARTFGQTSAILVNALEAGKPIIASDIGASREYVRNGVNGILVKPGDIEALARAIDTLLEDKRIRCSMGQRSREIAEKLDWNLISERTMQVYQEVITAKKLGS